MAIQILILNNINLHGFVNPYIYPLLFMLLPYELSTSWVVIIGFATGLFLDNFTNTPGMHAAASATVCFIRPFLLYIIRPSSGYDQGNTELTLSAKGIEWFIRYTIIFIFFHHFLYFIIEVWSFKFWNYTLLKILFSGLLSSFLILLLNIIFKQKSTIKK
jgi:hypothetical protein